MGFAATAEERRFPWLALVAVWMKEKNFRSEYFVRMFRASKF